MLEGGPRRAQTRGAHPALVPSLTPHRGFPRDLDARAKNEYYRATFRLPGDERLDGHTSCTLWTPFTKLHIPGQMFISGNYICFASKEEDACHLIIPLREVSTQPPPALPWFARGALSIHLSQWAPALARTLRSGCPGLILRGCLGMWADGVGFGVPGERPLAHKETAGGTHASMVRAPLRPAFLACSGTGRALLWRDLAGTGPAPAPHVMPFLPDAGLSGSSGSNSVTGSQLSPSEAEAIFLLLHWGGSGPSEGTSAGRQAGGGQGRSPGHLFLLAQQGKLANEVCFFVFCFNFYLLIWRGRQKQTSIGSSTFSCIHWLVVFSVRFLFICF